MAELIPLQEIKYNRYSLGDSFGKVFSWNGRLFRGVFPGWENFARELFSSGLIDALQTQGLIPKTTLTSYQLEEFGLVIEHELLPDISYPHEWSFSMLRNAGLCALEVNKIALSFGYETKDCHAYNIVFHHNRPVFVDIGSFVKLDDNNRNLLCYEEMLMDYYHPLKIWLKDYYTAKRIIADETGLLPHTSYFKIRYGFPLTQWHYVWNKFRKGVFKLYNMPRLKKTLIGTAVKRKSAQVARLQRKLRGLPLPRNKSTWNDYHHQYLDSAGNVKQSTERFDKIARLLEQHQVETVTELAGNQGVMSKIILQKVPSVKRIVCTDYDENAIDSLYLSIRNTALRDKIVPAITNFMTPVPNYFGSSPDQRFRSQCVLALAVTHHLILTQGFHIDTILSTIRQYTTQYAVLEFMPKGLWDGKKSPPFPEWYNRGWFVNHLSKHFTIISEEQTEENRITFFCSIH